MKTCILFSGFLRTFNINFPKIKSTIIDQFDDVDIYFHITSNEESEDKYLNNTKHLDFIFNTVKPTAILYEKDNPNYNNTYNLWYKFHRLNTLKTHHEKSNHFQYDLVIKIRPDMSINNTIDFTIEPNTIYIPSDSKIDQHKLTNTNDPYICDIFAYGDSNTMNKYFDIYLELDTLTKKYGNVSETLLYYYLKNNKINTKIIDLDYNIILSSCNVFAICGDSGSGKTTLGTILKNIFDKSFIMECDRYHKWERNDPHWKTLTHLNPNANYLLKMSDDIFDLKIGKNVYQVDYDHKNGKFTEKQEISTSDNIIVCGLHCMYSNTNNVFNVKIFIDTDENLRIPWKIQRDMKKRNYTIEKIIRQIEDRKEDYYNFIYPQKKDADIIINFFTDIPWDMDNINDEKNIYLKICVNENINYGKICLLLNKYDIQYKILHEPSFISFIFYKYDFNENLFNELSLNINPFNNYYDIIIFFIFYIHRK